MLGNRAVQSSPCRVSSRTSRPVDAGLRAVAVVLDLVHPLCAARGLVGLLRQARLEEGRQDALAGAVDVARVGHGGLARADHLGAAGVVLAQFADRRELAGGAAAEKRGRRLVGDVRLAGLPSEFVVGLDQQPRLGLLAAPRPHPHQVPAAVEAAAVQRDVEVAFGEPLVGIGGALPAPAIPHDHGAAAVLALGDVALEIEVLHRVILGADREPLLADDQARSARHRPALERAAELEPQIVMHPARIVLLHDELAAVARAAFRLGLGRGLGFGLGGAAEIALLLVGRERIAARCRLRDFIASCHDRSADHALRGCAICISQYFSARLARAAQSESLSSAR